MNNNGNGQPAKPLIVETRRGPAINGSRLTVFDIMGMLKYGRSPDYVQGWYHLLDEEMAAVMQYLKEHEEALEREYAEILVRAAAQERYWRERNKDVMNKPPSPPPNEGIARARARLAAMKKGREAEQNGQ